MEESKILYKVYSNDNKKTRLKRSKKYKRVWDADSQKYIKVKKVKKRIRMTDKEYKAYFDYPIPTKPVEVQLEPSKKPVINKHTTARNQPKKVYQIPDDTIKETLRGRTLEWNPEKRRYVFKVA